MRRTLIAMAIAGTTVTTAAFASPLGSGDVRAAAMGGTGIASLRATAGLQKNPAILALPTKEDTWGLTLPHVTAHVAEKGDMRDSIDKIQNEYLNHIDADIAMLQMSPPATDTPNGNVRDLGMIAKLTHSELGKMNDDAALLGVKAGVGLVIPSPTLGFGLSITADANAAIEPGIADADRALLQRFAAIFEDGVISSAERAANNDLFQTGTNKPVDFNTQSEITGIALGVSEVGLSFARQFTVPTAAGGKIVALGITPKFQQVMTYEYTRSLTNDENSQFDSAKIKDTERSSTHLNFDLGAAYDLNDRWRAGATLTNIIPVHEKTITGREFAINPALSTGIAFHNSWFTWAVDADLTETRGVTHGSDTQFVSTGIEFNPFNVLRLGLGYRANMASGSSVDDALTAGLGLNILGFNLGVAAAGNENDVTASVQLSLEY